MVNSLRPAALCFISPLLACLAALPLIAQNPGQPPAQNPFPLIKTGAQAVSIDVVVTRGSDEPVLGLLRQDVRVFEDGKPQAIDLFEEHSATAPVGDAVNVLLLDSLNTPEADQATVHKQVLDFLAKPNPGTRIAIYTLNSKLRLLQGFTSDGSLLRAALNSKDAAPATNPAFRTRDDDLRDKEELSIIGEMSNTGGADAEAPLASISRSQADVVSNQAGRHSSMTITALQEIARALAATPGRKNLIWFAGSFPISIFPNGQDRQTLANGREIEEAVHLTADLLTKSKVAVYPISAQGIQADPTTNADSAGQPSGNNFERNPNLEAPALLASAAAMDRLASDTGGQALYTSNNLSQAVSRAIRNGSHYYTLVYTPSNAQRDGKFRRIEVKLTQGHAKLSYRRGYYADDARTQDADSASKPAPDHLAPLLARGMPASTQVVYQARILPLAPQPAADAPRAGGNVKLPGPLTRYKVDFVLSSPSVALDAQPDGTHTGKIEVALMAYDPNGAVSNWTGQTLAISLNAPDYAQAQKNGIPVHLQLDLPQTELTLASGVYDLNARRAGTLEVPLDARTAASSDPP